MSKTIDRLSAVALRDPKPGKLFDGRGLYLDVRPNGSRYWRLKYRHAGKEKLLALGVYPEVGLAEARKRRDSARALLRDGTDPSDERRAARDDALRAARGTFGAVCTAWLEAKAKSWRPETRRKAEFVCKSYLLPALKNRRVGSLTSRDVGDVLVKIADHAPDIARKARQYAQGIVRHAIHQGLRDEGHVLVLGGILPTANKGHIAAATMPEDAAALMRAIEGYSSIVTRAALLLCAYTAQRPGTVATMRWDEIEIEAAEWRIPAGKMKTGHAHIVPLPRQAVAILSNMEAYSAGREYVFPPLARQKSPHLHRDSMSKALRDMGFRGRHATHGFRGMFRTLGRERLNIASDVLEAQLAHAKRGDVQKAYDRTTFSNERRKAMQRWADYLDGLQKRARVAPIRGRTSAA